MGLEGLSGEGEKGEFEGPSFILSISRILMYVHLEQMISRGV